MIPAVEAVQAQFGSLPLEERLSGIVSVRNQIDLYPRITAPVEEVAVQTGQQVAAGEVLVRLRDNEYRERLRQAEANLRIAEAQERQALAALQRHPERALLPWYRYAIYAALAAAGGVPRGGPIYQYHRLRTAADPMDITVSVPVPASIEIGDGFALAARFGSEAHDEIGPDRRRATNRAGGIEGGVSNGE